MSTKGTRVSKQITKPLRLASGDFDAPGRTRFVSRALTWVAPLVARLAQAGIDVDAEPMPAAETHAIALRRPGLGPRAALALEIDEQAIEAALELPASAPELEVLRHQLARASSAERIFGALAFLPEPFAIGVQGDEPVALSTLDVASLEGIVLRALEVSRTLRIGWRVPREVALEHEGDLPDQLEGALAALAVPFGLLLRDDARPPRPRLPVAARLFRRASTGARRSPKSSRIPIAAGVRVRVLAGPFEGKEAVVQELDQRGGARVRLGLLATRLGLADLVALEVKAEPRAAPKRPGRSGGRPALASSHRRR